MKVTRTKAAKIPLSEMHHNSISIKSFRVHSLRRWAVLLMILAIVLNMVEADESSTEQAKEADLITYYYNVSNIGDVNLTDVNGH